MLLSTLIKLLNALRWILFSVQHCSVFVVVVVVFVLVLKAEAE